MYRFIWKIKLYDHVSDVEFITHWQESSTVLQEYPGAMGTHIHMVRDEPRTYFLVAEWAFKEARDAMTADTDAGQSERAMRWAKFPPNDSFGDISIIMAGSEIGSVMPLPADTDALLS